MSDGTTTASTGDALSALGSLTQEADQANPDQAQQQQQVEQQQQADAAAEGAKSWGMLMFMVGGLVTMAAPELKSVYTEERCVAWGSHANLVAEKYGWNTPDNMPEIALLGCTIGFAVPTYLVLRANTKAKSVAGKIALWWRARRAGKAAAAAPAETGDTAPA